MWEILTLGKTPYSNIATKDIQHHVKMGKFTRCFFDFHQNQRNISDRLSMPTNISADIYALMTSCWNTIPSSRPTINQVQHRLKQSIKSDILATPRVSNFRFRPRVRFFLGPKIQIGISFGTGGTDNQIFRDKSHSRVQNHRSSSTYRLVKRRLVAKNSDYP